jgi:hypothetical protein
MDMKEWKAEPRARYVDDTRDGRKSVRSIAKTPLVALPRTDEASRAAGSPAIPPDHPAAGQENTVC